jgi:hypothetical protein
MKLIPDNRGISLALTIGLLLLLVAMMATINLLVIRSLRSSYQIEASDKAYFAAEAGIEDALYELSAHSAGYETDSRSDDFTNGATWKAEWLIDSYDLNNCINGLGTWTDLYTPNYCGRLYSGQKLVLNLFADQAGSSAGTNQINENNESIEGVGVNTMTVKIRVPNDIVSSHSLTELSIDNDRDLGKSTKAGPEAYNGLNEDSESDTGLCGNDADCDDLESEDSREDPVFLWRLVDDEGHSFQPLRGCKGDPSHPSHGSINATLCEKNFTLSGNELSVSILDTDRGMTDTGSIESLSSFLLGYPAGNIQKLQMEISVVAPMELVNGAGEPVPIPYYEYGMEYSAGAVIPATYFAIESDGYYNDFKQSITTNVTPSSTTQLLDLTIIQQ